MNEENCVETYNNDAAIVEGLQCRVPAPRSHEIGAPDATLIGTGHDGSGISARDLWIEF